jgi:hypothetical protein
LAVRWLNSWVGKSANAYSFPVLAEGFKSHDPIPLGKKGIILAHAYVFPGVKLGPNLADEDIPRFNPLSGIPFDPQPLSTAVSTVSGAASRFFVCHNRYSLTKNSTIFG